MAPDQKPPWGERGGGCQGEIRERASYKWDRQNRPDWDPNSGLPPGILYLPAEVPCGPGPVTEPPWSLHFLIYSPGSGVTGRQACEAPDERSVNSDSYHETTDSGRLAVCHPYPFPAPFSCPSWSLDWTGVSSWSAPAWCPLPCPPHPLGGGLCCFASGARQGGASPLSWYQLCQHTVCAPFLRGS